MKTKVAYWWYLVIFLAGLLLLGPLLRPGFFVSDDGNWMVIRLSAFFQSWRDGQFPVRFLGRLNHSYGYPVANFLYPGFLYLGSLIHASGFSFPDTVKIILGGSVIVTAFWLFLWLKRDFSPASSSVGVLSFIFAPYLAFDLYQRGSVGEVIALVAAAAGMYALRANRRSLFPAIVFFLILGHNCLALLFLALFIGYILRHQKRDFWLPLFLGVGLATFFWLPAILEQRYVLFDTISVSQPERYFVQGNSLYLLGIVNVLVWVLVCLRRNTIKNSDLYFFLLVSVISVWLATPLSAAIWSMPIFSKLFQFPYRMLAISLIVNTWLTAALLQSIALKYRWKLLTVFFIFWLLSLVPVLSRIKIVIRPEGYYTTNEATTTVADEYLPRWVTQKPQQRASQKIEFWSGSGQLKVRTVSTKKIDLEVETETNSVLQINTIYYPGWGALVDGNPVQIDYLSGGGIMRVAIPPGKHRLISEFRETPLRLLADALSMGFALGYLGYLFHKRK